MIIKNASVFTEDKVFEEKEIIIEEGRFQEVATDYAEVVDAKGCYAIPGLIDIHFHGCMGYDFCDGTQEAIESIAKYELSQGITTMVPATMTLSKKELLQIMKAAGAYENKEGATLAGINMEGPFINAHKKGAQAPTYIQPPQVDMFRELQKAANGLIRLVDIAPEVQGGLEFVKACSEEVAIAFAHTETNYETAKLGYDLGARHVTHLYNAMLPFSHREPGLIGAAYDSKHCMVELICDGIHIHPSVVRATFDLFGEDRVVLISDSTCATGMKDGRYMLGGQDIVVINQQATLPTSGAIAGSTRNLLECLQIAVRDMNIPLEKAVAAATMNAAKSVDIYGECGSISNGKRGDVVLLNSDLSIHSVIQGGQKII